MFEDDREGLRHLYKDLLHLHSALLDVVKADFTKTVRPLTGPMDLYNLVLNDPFFAWLRPLSSALALLDELIDAKRPITPEDVLGVKASMERLFEAGEPDGFGANFRNRLEVPAVGLAYGGVTGALRRIGSAEA